MNEVFIVKHRDIYDRDHEEFIVGVASSYDNAVEMIKDEIKNVACSYHSYRYSIEGWDLNKRDAGGLTTAFTVVENIEWAKELGVYCE